MPTEGPLILDRPVTIPIVCRKGNTFRIRYAIMDEDLTGNSFAIVVRNNSATVITITGAVGIDGRILFQKTATEMDAIAVGKYSYEWKRTYADNFVLTFFIGDFVVN
jgi:hypothetical protein